MAVQYDGVYTSQRKFAHEWKDTKEEEKAFLTTF
jgi:hypothetical protein